MENNDILAPKKRQYESDIFILHSDSSVEVLDPGIRRQLMGYNNDVMTARVWFVEGAIGEIHSHPHTQVTYIESGCFSFTINNKTKMVKTGDTVYIPPNTPHGSICLESGSLIDVFSPIRQDFLDSKQEASL